MFYIDKNTAVDDVIEHIIERLNTDYTGCYLYISEFCIDVNNNVDIKMALKVHSTMRTHKVCSDDSESESNPNITITAKGIEIYENGGWKKYIREYEKLKINDQKIQKWGLWGSKSTVLGTFIALASFLWGLFLFMDNNRKRDPNQGIERLSYYRKKSLSIIKSSQRQKFIPRLTPSTKARFSGTYHQIGVFIIFFKCIIYNNLKNYRQNMTDEQYKELIRQLSQVLDNQVILGNKLNGIQADVETIISNQKILGNDQDKLIEDVQKIKRAINK